jgi:hypothetical protein
MQFKKIIASAALVVMSQLCGGYFVFTGGSVNDYTGAIFSKISAIEEVLKTAESVQHTLSVLEQVAQMYAIYNNATDMYASIGNAVSSMDRMNQSLPGVISSWTADGAGTDIFSAGRQLDRWGVDAAETGTLARINNGLFGTGSVGGNLTDTFRDISRLTKSAPGQIYRDRSLRRIFDGAADQKVGGGTVAFHENADGTLKAQISQTTSGGEVVVDATDENTAEMATRSADTAMAEVNLELLRLSEDRRIETEMAGTLVSSYGESGTNADMTTLARDSTVLKAQKVKMLNNAIASDAAQADSQMTTAAAYHTIYETRINLANERRSAARALSE